MAQQDESQDGIEPSTSCASNVFRTALALPFGATDSKNSISKATLPKAFPLKLNPGDPDRFRNTGRRLILRRAIP